MNGRGNQIKNNNSKKKKGEKIRNGLILLRLFIEFDTAAAVAADDSHGRWANRDFGATSTNGF